MTDEEDDLFNDALNALDDITLDSKKKKDISITEKKSEPARPQQETTIQSPFPFAPALNDPNIKLDVNIAKYLIDTEQYDKAIDTMINILRSKSKKIDKNVVAEIVLEIAQKGKITYIKRLLPYLTLALITEDPILKMSINNAMLHVKTEYDHAVNKIKIEIKNVCDAIYEQFNTTYVPILDLVYNIGTSVELIFSILEIMLKNKEINGQIDIAKNIFEYEPKGALYRCPHCGKDVESDTESCPFCWADIHKCGICFGFIKEDEMVTCPFCGGFFHEKHLVQWVKKSGACPVCQNKLIQTEIATVLCCVCGMEIKKGEKDVIECPHCKAAAHKDHWKEYLDVYGECPDCHKHIKK